MSSHGKRRYTWRLGALAMGLMLALSASYVVFTVVQASPPLPARKPLTVEQQAAVKLYQLKLAEWQREFTAYEAKANAYWDRITEMRQARRQKRAGGEAIVLADYVLEQPPAYAGPPRPEAPAFLPKPQPPSQGRTGAAVPVVADFLHAASEYFQYAPERPVNEIDFKRAYVRAAHAAGIIKEQAIRIYAFETGGNGRHDLQAGVGTSGKGRAITTALGYNQLLATNTIGLLAEHGEHFLDALSKNAESATPERRKQLSEKARRLRAMISFARTFPKRWAEHDKVARTPKGYALHALNLDIDIGPLLQVRKLLDSIEFARMKGINNPLSGAELEMMNLMGDGSGLDILLLTHEMRQKVPTSNFFQRGGYERNPIVAKYNLASALLEITDSRMDTLGVQPGAREMAAEFDALAHASKTASGADDSIIEQ